MPSSLSRVRRALADLVIDDRSSFKRIDASPARYDGGEWLKPRPLS
jgi:hypothetical protein